LKYPLKGGVDVKKKMIGYKIEKNKGKEEQNEN